MATKFYRRVSRHDSLRMYFTHIDVHKMQAMASDLWQISLGEGGVTTEKGLAAVHGDLHITSDSFRKFVQCYLSVLREEGVSAEDLSVIEDNLTKHLSVIVRPE